MKCVESSWLISREVRRWLFKQFQFSTWIMARKPLTNIKTWLFLRYICKWTQAIETELISLFSVRTYQSLGAGELSSWDFIRYFSLRWDDLPWMRLAAQALWSCAPCSTLQLCQRSKILLTGGLVGACRDLEWAPCCWKIQLSKKDQKVGWHMINGTSKKGAIEVLPLIQQALYWGVLIFFDMEVWAVNPKSNLMLLLKMEPKKCAHIIPKG